METEENKKNLIEFDDTELLFKDWLAEQNKLIREQFNAYIRLMAKHSDLRFSEFRNMYFDEFMENLETFKKKKRLQTKFDFLDQK